MFEYDPATVSRPDVTPEFKCGLPATTRQITERAPDGRIVASTPPAKGSAERTAALFAPHEQLFLERVLAIAQGENARAALQASIYGWERIHGKIPLELNATTKSVHFEMKGALNNILVSSVNVGDVPVVGHGEADLNARLLALRAEIDAQLAAAPPVLDLEAVAVEADAQQEAERDDALYGTDDDPVTRIDKGMPVVDE